MKFLLQKYSLLLFSCFVLFSLFSNGQNINDFSTELPLIIIDTQGKPIVDEPKVTGNMKIISNASGLNRLLLISFQISNKS